MRPLFTPRHLGTALCALLLAGLSGLAAAQTTFDVIGPHEYDLPIDFKPFNVFVQYAYVQRNNRLFDGSGDRAKGPGSTAIVGLSKYVHFWTPESNRNIGLAWEVIVPEISVRGHHPASQSSGIGDPMTGFAIWYKPTPDATVGFQSFVQIPAGDQDVSDTNWKNLSSLFWDVRLTEQWGWTADAGFVFQDDKNDGTKPGTVFHTNQRLGYRVSPLLEPFLALDYERGKRTSTVDGGHALDGGLGLMLHTFDNQSITLRYAKSIRGENHAANNSFNLKYAYVW
ncbi:transporter [Nitrogeniibacter mangrovi]|uniref:Transporter n=1 Tax=Nitrogeniibacter mangrovi TaxID=2016596 RepID=A0A6C1B8U8_9RHOO|nr:transporter [Nitrogeniibacter mangrovi]QID19255.1 transporter [Nitrogeniibacter mangrovi]